MNLLKRIFKSILFIIMIFLLTINTETKVFSSSDSKSSSDIGVIFFSLDNSIMSQLKQELENLQKDNQIKISVFDAKNNISIQNEILDSLLKRKVDLVISMIPNTTENSVRDFILRVKPYNIPLFMFNIPPEVAKNVSRDYSKVAFGIPDSKKAGEMQGEIVRDSWNNNSIIDKNKDGILQYILVRGPVNDTIANQRTQGFTSIINGSGIKTEKLMSAVTNWTTEIAKDQIENILLTYANKTEAIIANDDDIAVGAIKALQKYGYNMGDSSKFIPVFGIDGSSEAKNLIDKGFMSNTVVMDLKKVAQEFYDIGINLISNENPLKNTNLKSEDGVIIIETDLKKYKKD